MCSVTNTTSWLAIVPSASWDPIHRVPLFALDRARSCDGSSRLHPRELTALKWLRFRKGKDTMKQIFLLVALGLSLVGAHADDPGFVTPQQVDASILLPPPPVPGSPRAVAEMAELKQIAASRTREAFAAAARDATDETGDVFSDALGPAFDLTKLPATAKMLHDIHMEEETLSKPAKEFFHRDRPWVSDPSLETCTAHKTGRAQNSYPSGHATGAYAMGVILASLIPGKAQQILARSSEFSENRLVCGMHFRSDIVAGQTLGTIIATDLLNNSQFREEYNAAASELSAQHLR